LAWFSKTGAVLGFDAELVFFALLQAARCKSTEQNSQNFLRRTALQQTYPGSKGTSPPRILPDRMVCGRSPLPLGKIPEAPMVVEVQVPVSKNWRITE